MVEPLLITDAPALASLIRRLAGRHRIAFDTEAASFHRYVDRVYLVQVSSDDETAIVDPLAVQDLQPVGRLLADPAVEVIFHDADYDLRILDRDYGFRATNIWDTRVAAQLAGETSFGLGALLEQHFGVRLSKALQRADWSRRPLTDEMIAYAAADTAHLPTLRDRLEARLKALGRLHWAEEEFYHLEAVRWSGGAQDDDQPWRKLKGARQLRGQGLAVLRAVWRWRERTAEERDRAPFRVLGNDGVVNIARAMPRTLDELAAVDGVAASIAQRYGAEIMDAVHAAFALPRSQWPVIEPKRSVRPDAAAEERFQRLRALRAQRAEALQLDAGLVCPNATLMAIAQRNPASRDDLDEVPDLRRWQREALGEDAMLRTMGG
jgi:ribonuclease D